MSVFQITILFLYVLAGILLIFTRLPKFSQQATMYFVIAIISAVTGLFWHGWMLGFSILVPGGLSLSIGNTASLIGLQLALIALIGTIEKVLRGLAGGLLILAGLVALFTDLGPAATPAAAMSWHLQMHVLISLFAYGLLTVGAIVALYALAQERRLHAGILTSFNQLFAPLETTEAMLFGVATAGFFGLVVAVSTGFAFVDNILSQHLAHKTVLSILAVVIFGVLLTGRWLAGWRGKRAIYLYLGGFGILCLAYFGSRFVLEEMLGRSWS